MNNLPTNPIRSISPLDVLTVATRVLMFLIVFGLTVPTTGWAQPARHHNGTVGGSSSGCGPIDSTTLDLSKVLDSMSERMGLPPGSALMTPVGWAPYNATPPTADQASEEPEERPNPSGTTPQSECNKKWLTTREQRQLITLKIERQKLDSLINALRDAPRGQIPDSMASDFNGSRVVRQLLNEAKEEGERLRKKTPGKTVVVLTKYFISPTLTGADNPLPDEHALAIGILGIAADQSGALPVTAEDWAMKLLTEATLGKGIPGALNPYALALFTTTQAWDGAKNWGKPGRPPQWPRSTRWRRK
jgi:hypothetical protein